VGGEGNEEGGGGGGGADRESARKGVGRAIELSHRVYY